MTTTGKTKEQRIRDALAEAGILEEITSRKGTITDNAATVLTRRYLGKNRDGQIEETADGMWWRVANNLAEADLLYDDGFSTDVAATAQEFYEVMRSLEFLPNSPTLMNAGRELQQLSACFVLPVEDSLDAIFEKVKQTAVIHKSGGGTGFAFSRLRPAGDVVGSTGGIASGPVSFIGAFDAATDVVKQGGTRRGANMAILRVDHPDIMDFIHVKDTGQHLQNFNISVGITNEFMDAMLNDELYAAKNPRTGETQEVWRAIYVWEHIIESAHATGDPGVVFLDRINEDNPNPHLGEIESTNPCGEQPLLPYESCNLGSINLARMVKDIDCAIGIDFERLANVIKTAAHMLDNVIDMNEYPLPEIAEMSRKTRRIGLGVMGWADLLIMLGIRYDSEEALELAEQVMGFIRLETYKASEALAEKRGIYPAWVDAPSGTTWIRNSAPTTIAPTGTISIIAGASSGIEPLFALSYTRNVMDGTRLTEYNPMYEAIVNYEIDNVGEPQQPGWLSDLFRVSHDIDPMWHVRMQAAFQKYTDNAVSKTINFPASATVEDVDRAYRLAYELGCKGITIYRDGSKDNQVLSTGTNGHGEIPHEKEFQEQLGIYINRNTLESETVYHLAEPEYDAVREWTPTIYPRSRPVSMTGVTERVKTAYGNMYVTVNFDEDGYPFEVFGNLGKAGSNDSANVEAISRMVSLLLRSGVDYQHIVEQLRGITSEPVWDKGVQVKSVADAMALVLSRQVPRVGTVVPINEPSRGAAEHPYGQL